MKLHCNVYRHIWALSLAALVACLQPAGARLAANPDGGCFSIVVGKAASADGWVMMAHNEDDGMPQVVNHHKIPRKTHAANEVLELENGARIVQPQQTWAYIWSEMPGMDFSDSYLNEWGVCICSDACPSREDQPQLVDGGITHTLRQVVAERAKTAREGVHMAGDLIERFGYASSGRTYIICDPNEGSLLSVVNGVHWAARRVPDSQVALIANSYTIHEIDLADTLNYLGSPDIIDYAVERGWHDPAAAPIFDFAAVYADSTAGSDERNIGRQWDGLCRIAAEPPSYASPLPFSVAPKGKVAAKDLMAILRRHYEETPLYAAAPTTGCPHDNPITTICGRETQTSFVAQLRGGRPAEIGLVYWVCLSSPCASCYVPFYFGLDSFPSTYQGPSAAPTEEEYLAKVEQPTFAVDEASAFWTFSAFRHHLEQQYGKSWSTARRMLDSVEATAFMRQAEVEKAAVDLFAADKTKALGQLVTFTRDIHTSAIDRMRRFSFGGH